MSVTLNLSAETERLLREHASQRGQTLEAYLEQLAEREVRGNETTLPAAGQVPLDLAEFERLLDELGEGLPPLPTLPNDFSRADIYDEHD